MKPFARSCSSCGERLSVGGVGGELFSWLVASPEDGAGGSLMPLATRSGVGLDQSGEE